MDKNALQSNIILNRGADKTPLFKDLKLIVEDLRNLTAETAFDDDTEYFNKVTDTSDDIIEGSVNKFVTADQQAALNAANSPSAINPVATINDLGPIADKYYTTTFTSALSVTVLGTTHLFGRIPDVTVYNAAGVKSFANEVVNTVNFNVVVTFNQPRTGTLILT